MSSLRHILVVAMLLYSSVTIADSPLTSTYFANIYRSEKVVKKAIKADGKITRAIMKYLADKDAI